MAENRKERGQGLYYFKRGQLIFLAVGFTITSVLVFLLGVLIGQRIEERKLVKKEEPLVQIPAQSQGHASKSAASSKEEMTFYDTLGKASPPPQTNVEPPQKKTKAAERMAKPAARETEAVAKEKKAASAQIAQEKPGAGKTGPSSEDKEKSSLPKKEETAQPRVKEGAPAGEGRWTVQVNAFPDEEPARNLAERLKTKGYDAYMATTDIKGRTWYRVRVGRFQSLEEARKLQETLKSKENFTKAITASRQ